MLLRSVSRLFVCLVLPLQAMALHASPSNDCWNVAMSESFSPSNYNNFSNLPHIANNGFSRAEYGSSGAFSDVCALVPGMISKRGSKST
ncbi:MAG TPA: hypothetical protein PK198_19180, partial [Saprospiraceae bacterium]|nr:hypothetical protein [Saprospiraceae bacterium]